MLLLILMLLFGVCWNQRNYKIRRHVRQALRLKLNIFSKQYRFETPDVICVILRTICGVTKLGKIVCVGFAAPVRRVRRSA